MDNRFRFFLILMVGALTAAVWLLPEWWTLLNPESPAAEGLPNMPIELRVQFASLPDNFQDAYFAIYEGDEDDAIEGQPDWALALVEAAFTTEDSESPENIQPFEPAPDARVVATGTFVGADVVRAARGDLTIYEDSTGTRLLRLDGNFFSSRAPDVHLIFTRNPDPMDGMGVGIDYIDLGTLKGNFGAQTFFVPPSVDFSRYPMIALYSETHNGILGTATLR